MAILRAWRRLVLCAALPLLLLACESDTLCNCPAPVDYIEHTVRSVDFESHRVFRLTAPGPLFFEQGDDYAVSFGDTIQIPFSLQDQSGRWETDWRIDLSTLDIYVKLTGPYLDDPSQVLNAFPGRAYMETTGYYWGYQYPEPPDPDASPEFGDEEFWEAPRWRRLGTDEWLALTKPEDGVLIGVLLTSGIFENTIMGVTYDVVDGNRSLVMRVGRPWFSGEFEPIPNPEGPTDDEDRIYYFKLIKGEWWPAPDPASPQYGQGFDLSWEYMLRNFYSLQHEGIDPTTLEVEIRLNNNDPQNEYEQGDPETRRRWINVFGLDTKDTQGNPVPGGDGRIDLEPGTVFPQLGLLRFPSSTPYDEEYLTGPAEFGGNGGTPSPDLYRRLLTLAGADQNHYFNIIVRYPKDR